MSLLRLDSISLKFGGLTAVDGVSFSIECGEIFTMIGPNGAGKTSIFNIISRFYEPSGGRIFFDDVEITGVPAHDIANLGIARTFQNIELFANATVLDNLLVGRHIHRATSIYQDIDFFDLQRYREQLIANLPYGVRKVCEVARALCTEPKLLLLDEPSSGLNVEETEDMVYWINDIRSDLGITVLMVEHDMTLVNRVSDRVLALNYGQVLALGAPADVARDPAVIAAYLGS
jgi:branched-chain amino acid transport system ATP-binding protein